MGFEILDFQQGLFDDLGRIFGDERKRRSAFGIKGSPGRQSLIAGVEVVEPFLQGIGLFFDRE